MPKAKIYNQQGEKVGEIELSDKVFGVKANEALVHQAMVAQMANERQVLAHTKGRAEVRGGGRKPWRQKGTGRARAGSSRSPLWIGGGVTFGPTKDRNFSLKINKKMKVKAILMALSDKVLNNKLVVLEKLEMPEFKTKIFNEVILKLEKHFNIKELKPKENKKEDKVKKQKKSILVINGKKDEKIKFSARNLTGVKLINLDNINIIDLLKYKDLILTADTVKKLEEKYK
jgi:large subunit ribosomal protein L4